MFGVGLMFDVWSGLMFDVWSWLLRIACWPDSYWFDVWSWLLRIACWPDSLLFSFQLLAVNFCLALVPC